MTFDDPADYDRISQGDMLCLPDVRAKLIAGESVTLVNETTGESYPVTCSVSDRQRDILLAGGLLGYTKANAES